MASHTELRGDGREPLTVLVADDDDDMRSLVVETLRMSGCAVREASDGEQLLALLERSFADASLGPAVLVTDVKMPKLSGLGVLNALRQARWNLPVVVITALRDLSVETVATRMGAVSVLHKPFDQEDLVSAVWSARSAGAMRLREDAD